MQFEKEPFHIGSFIQLTIRIALSLSFLTIECKVYYKYETLNEMLKCKGFELIIEGDEKHKGKTE